MERITVSIDQIKNNPNLDLSERIKKYSNEEKWLLEDIDCLAIASIKQEYEYWANNRTNISAKTDDLLLSILNGHILNNIEGFEMMCDDPIKVQEYSKYEGLRKRITDNNGIQLEDFNQLCHSVGFDYETINLIRKEFEKKGLIIEQYDESIHR